MCSNPLLRVNTPTVKEDLFTLVDVCKHPISENVVYCAPLSLNFPHSARFSISDLTSDFFFFIFCLPTMLTFRGIIL